MMIEAFSGLDSVLIGKLAMKRQYPRPTKPGGERMISPAIYSQGEEGTHLFLLEKGRARLSYLTEAGEEVIVWLPKEGELFGAIEKGRYSCTALTNDKVTAQVWDREELIAKVPGMACRLGALSARRVRQLERRFAELASWSVPRRLASAVLRLQTKSGDIDLGRETIAQYLGTTLYTVSRVFAAWGRDGLVRVGRQTVHVINRDRLIDIAEGKAVDRCVTV